VALLITILLTELRQQELTVRTRASEAAFSSACPQSRKTHAQLQDAQDPESEPEIVMDDVETDDIAGSGSDSRGPIKEANNAIDKEDANLIYDRAHFRKDKAQRHYNFYYQDRRIIVERGVVVSNFDAHTPRVWAVLDA
jgi:hypothetical protein